MNRSSTDSHTDLLDEDVGNARARIAVLQHALPQPRQQVAAQVSQSVRYIGEKRFTSENGEQVRKNCGKGGEEGGS